MSKKAMFLDSDSQLFEENLRFVKDDFEEEMKTMLDTRPENKKFKIVKPSPGHCIKAFKADGSGKLFVNLCQTAEIQAAKELSEADLIGILESETPDRFKIPMSISEPYDVKDKSGNTATACDIAINDKFFQKIVQSQLFSNFLTALMFEAIDDKYKIKCEEDSWTVLKNLKAMTNGSLKSHRIENRDNEQMKEFYKPEGSDKPKSLIQEIDDKDAQLLRINVPKKLPPRFVPDALKVSQASHKQPDYRLIKQRNDKDEVVQIIGEFHMPDVSSATEILLDVGEDRVVVEAKKRNYHIEGFIVDYKVDTENVHSNFDTGSDVLTVNLPVCA